jgi:hypothetical protein
MEQALIQDWTDSQVILRSGEERNVKYRVFKDGGALYQEICEADGAPIHTLEMPEGVRLDQKSYEVMLRYVLLDVVAA